MKCFPPYYIKKEYYLSPAAWRYDVNVRHSPFYPGTDKDYTSSTCFPHEPHKCHRYIPLGKVGSVRSPCPPL